jgi:hypothetical protein
MKKIYTLFTSLSLCSLLSLFSCEKAINFKLEDSKPLLVVDAEIENNKAPRVLLSNSISYYSQVSTDVFLKSFVHDADVSISNGTVTHKLIEYTYEISPGYNGYYYGIDSGSLNTAFIGTLNTTYDLKIIVAGNEYHSSTTIPDLNVVPDSVFFKPTPQSPDSNKRSLFLKATDPAGLGNYIRYFTKKNEQPFYPGPNSVFTDEIVDGSTYNVQLEQGINRNSPPLCSNYFFKSDTITFKLCNINRSTYKFWNTWEFVNQSIGNPFSQPGKVEGNITNGALGSFCGYAAWYKTIIVQ